MHYCALMHSPNESKHTLIIDAHPDPESFSSAIARTSLETLGPNNATILELRDLNFDLSLRYGYRKRMDLEEDLQQAQHLISGARHLILVTPVWWGSVPALLKGFLDRVLLPGFGFRYRKNSALWDKLLKGRSAQVYITMDSPYWWFRYVYKNPAINMLKKTVLEFCGFSPVKIRVFDQVRFSDTSRRQRWLERVRKESGGLLRRRMYA